MLTPVLLVVTMAALASSSPLPDKAPTAEFGGFRPVHGSRGAGPASGYKPPVHPPPHPPVYSGPGVAGAFSGGDGGGSGFGGGGGGGFGGHGIGGGGGVGNVGGPTKTIYVKVPPANNYQQAPLKPIAAGPPRKHYKIVFIRAPPPPPQAQPILPPRTEQKTLIYVLHQRPEPQEQQVIKVPHVNHEPEVFFLQYDNPPTAEELQQISAGNLQGYTVAPQRTGGNDGSYLVGRTGEADATNVGSTEDVANLSPANFLAASAPAPDIVNSFPTQAPIVVPAAPPPEVIAAVPHSTGTDFAFTGVPVPGLQDPSVRGESPAAASRPAAAIPTFQRLDQSDIGLFGSLESKDVSLENLVPLPIHS